MPSPASEPRGLIVTGASSDIGAAIARHFVERRPGLRLVLTSRSGTAPAASADDQTLTGLDLTRPEHAATLASAARNTFDGPFALVHCIGQFWDHKTIVDCSPIEAAGLMASHYMTLYTTLHAVLPVMVDRGGGRILGMSCTSVGFHYPEMAAFTSAKAAVECLIRCTANEWSDKGIVANAIALSTVATPKVMQSKPLASEENYVRPEEVCLLVEDMLFARFPYLSGSIVRPVKHSATFYNRAYFERNPRHRASDPSGADCPGSGRP